MRGYLSARRRAYKHGVLSALLGACLFVTSSVVALPGSFVIAAHAASSGQPNLFDPSSAATSINHLPPEPSPVGLQRRRLGALLVWDLPDSNSEFVRLAGQSRSAAARNPDDALRRQQRP